MNIYFITPSDVKKASLIQMNVDEKIILSAITTSQDIELRIVLGDQTYFYLLDEIKKQNDDPDYEMNEDDKNIIKTYIRPYLTWETLRSFIIANEFKLTQKGTQRLSNPNALNVSTEELAIFKNQIDNQVDSYKRILIQYLKSRGINTNSSYVNTGGGFRFRKRNNSCNISSSSGSPVVKYIPLSEKGKPNGVASLDSNGFVPETQLPADLVYQTYLVSNYYNKTEIDDIIAGIEVDLTDYYTKSETDSLLDDKVDKEAGKGLSSNDFTDADKMKLDNLHNYDDTEIRDEIAGLSGEIDNLENQIQLTNSNLENNYYNSTQVNNLLSGKVDNADFNNLTSRVNDNENSINDLQDEVDNLPVLPAGGTTNQILRKTSNNDYEYDWSNETATFAPLNQILVGTGTGYSSSSNFQYNLGNGFFTSQFVSWTNSGGVTSITTSGHMALATSAVEIRFHNNVLYGTKYGQFHYGTSTPAASAIGDFFSTTRGFLIPRMTKTQRNAIASPADGLQIIVTGESGGSYLSIYNSAMSQWQKVNTTAD